MKESQPFTLEEEVGQVNQGQIEKAGRPGIEGMK